MRRVRIINVGFSIAAAAVVLVSFIEPLVLLSLLLSFPLLLKWAKTVHNES